MMSSSAMPGRSFFEKALSLFLAFILLPRPFPASAGMLPAEVSASAISALPGAPALAIAASLGEPYSGLSEPGAALRPIVPMSFAPAGVLGPALDGVVEGPGQGSPVVAAAGRRAHEELPALPAPSAPKALIGVLAPSDESGRNLEEGVFSSLVSAGVLAEESSRPSASAVGASSRFQRFFHGEKGRARTQEPSPVRVAWRKAGSSLRTFLRLRPKPQGEPARAASAQAPKRSVMRAFEYGYVAGRVAAVATLCAEAAAKFSGLLPHADFVRGLLDAGTNSLNLWSLGFNGIVFMPVVDALLFNVGLLRVVERGLHEVVPPRAATVIAASLSALACAFWHALSGGIVLLGLRLATSLLAARSYVREGCVASVTQNAVTNMTFYLIFATTSLLPPGPADVAMTLMTCCGALGFTFSAWALWKQRAERNAGVLARCGLEKRTALALGALLLAGTLLFLPRMLPASLLAALALYLVAARQFPHEP